MSEGLYITAMDISSILTKSFEFLKTYNKNIILGTSMLIAAISINQAIINNTIGASVTSNVSTMILSILIGVGYFMFTTLQPTLKEDFVSIAFTGGIYLIVAILIYTFVKVDAVTFSLFAYSITIVLSLIFITGLALFFYIFSNYLKSFTGFTGFLIHFLFYIPCLLISFVNYIVNEFNLTTKPVFILFILEILLLLLYIYIPQFITHISSKEGIPILEDSVFLNYQQSFPMKNHTKLPDMELQIAGNTKETVIRNYAISMWTYVNKHSSGQTETDIFNYGNGKPKVTYYRYDNNDNTADKYRIYFTNESDGIDTTKPYYDISLPMQRWNNLVFNYSSTHADLFVNGYLERTFKFSNEKIPSYSPSDMITVGSDNGIHGAISNIRYYPTTLSKHRISNMYTIFMKKTPPTFNL